jgi:hypothetical protein
MPLPIIMGFVTAMSVRLWLLLHVVNDKPGVDEIKAWFILVILKKLEQRELAH